MRQRRLPPDARGFGLVTAIFVLVVLAGLGFALVSLQTTQSKAGALDVQATRAYLAARSGIEWALWRSLRSPPLACANNSYSFKLPATTLNSFTVTVVCTSTAIPLADGTFITTNTLTSTACNAPDGSGNCPSALAAPGPDYIERRIVASYQQ